MWLKVISFLNYKNIQIYCLTEVADAVTTWYLPRKIVCPAFPNVPLIAGLQIQDNMLFRSLPDWLINESKAKY